MKKVSVVLIGWGRVGKDFFQILAEKTDLCKEQYKLDVRVNAIFRSRSGLYSLEGLNPSEVFEQNPSWDSTLKPSDIISQGGHGVLVLCTHSSLETGEPGISYIHQALDRGLHVVTADKGPLVAGFRSIRQKARENALKLKYSGAAAAALPTVDVALFSLAGAEIIRIEGILNGTTNYILTSVQQGIDYEDALKEARSKGIAEPDPSLDIEGWDTASKILIIANSVLDTQFTLDDIKIEGITRIPSSLIEESRKPGKSLKLLGILSREKKSYTLAVALTIIESSHPLYGVDGAEKGISFLTDTMGRVTVTGGKSDPRGAGASLLKDILNIYREN